MEVREDILRGWFAMWLAQGDTGILDLFAEDACYIESWGPRYEGAAKIKLWFDEWNTRGRVLQWEIRQFFHKDDQTVVEWYFRNQMQDGRVEAFDGLSLVRWTPENKIAFLQEFGCNMNRYDPYQEGPAPKFREETARWF